MKPHPDLMPNLDRQETRTCLFTDIVGSTDRTARLDVETAKRIITRTFDLFKQCLPKDSVLNLKAEGAVEKFVNGRIVADTGDGVFADFMTVGAAIETALKFQWLLAHEKWETEPVEVRMGIDTGDVTFRQDAGVPDREIPVGDVTNRAARIMSCALGGQILISEGVSYHGRQKVVGVHPSAIHQPATETRAEIDYEEIGYVRYKGDQVDAGAPPVLLYEVGVKGQLQRRITTDPEKCRPCDRRGRQAPMPPEFTPVANKEVPGASNGPWILERWLGKGGFGEAWLARHAVRLGDHNTRVFKFPNDPARVRAFLRETNLADILKDKKLPGIIQVEEYREKPCFIATPYYRNGSLLDWSEANKEAFASLSQRQRIDFMIELARIVEGAHRIGIAHKDIKPANVFLEDDTTVLRPVLADFGVGEIFLTELREEYQQIQSRDLNRAISIIGTTRTGTEMYWPPEFKKPDPVVEVPVGDKEAQERANKEAHERAKKADVYALGIVLYQLIIGDFNQPWESAQECERRIPDDASRPLNPFLRKVIMGTLDAVEYRTASAGELAGKLASMEQDCADSEQARLLGELRLSQEKAKEARQRVRRLQLVLGLVACLLVVAGVLALVAVWQTNIAKRNEERAVQKEQELQVATQLVRDEAAKKEKALRAAKEQEGIAQQNALTAKAAEAKAVVEATAANKAKALAEEEKKAADLARAQAVVSKQRADASAEDARKKAAEAEASKVAAEASAVKEKAAAHVADAERQKAKKSAEDEQLAKVQAQQERDAKASLLNEASAASQEAGVEANRHKKTISSALFERALKYNQANSIALLASGMHVFGSRLVTRTATIMGTGVNTVEFAPDYRWFIIGCKDGSLRIMSPETGLERVLTQFTGEVTTVAISSDGKWVAAGGKDKLVKILNVLGTEAAIPDITMAQPVRQVRFSRDDRFLAVATDDHRVALVDAKRGGIKGDFGLDVDKLKINRCSLYFGPDGDSLEASFSNEMFTGSCTVRASINNGDVAIVSCDKYNHLVRSKSGRLAAYHTPIKKEDLVTCRFLTNDAENIPHLFIDSDTGIEREFDFGTHINRTEISNDGSIVAGVAGRSVFLGVITTGLRFVLGRCENELTSVTPSPDGQWVACGDSKGLVQVFDTSNTDQKICEIYVGEGPVENLSFSNDGRFLVATSGACIRILEWVPELSIHRTIAPIDDSIQTPKDASLMAAWKWSGKQVLIFNENSWRCTQNVSCPEGVYAACLNKNGTRLGFGSASSVGMIDVTTKSILWSKRQGMPVRCLAFSPDEKFLDAGMGADDKPGSPTSGSIVRLMTETGERSGSSYDRLPKELLSVHKLKHSPDGGSIAVRTQDFLNRMHPMFLCSYESGKVTASAEFGQVVDFDITSDGKFLAAATNNESIGIWDLRKNAAAGRVSFDQGLNRCGFIPGSALLLASCADASLRIVSAGNWREISRTELHNELGGNGFSASFTPSPSGSWMILGNETLDETRVIDCRWFQYSDAIVDENWMNFLALQAGRIYREQGVLTPLSQSELKACVNQLQEFVDSKSAPAEKVWQHATLKWWRMLPEEKTISPWSGATIRETTGTSLMAVKSVANADANVNAINVIRKCVTQAPWHPLSPLSMARRGIIASDLTKLLKYGERPELPVNENAETNRRQFLARQTLTRLRDADESVYGRGVLAEYARWAAGILKDELGMVAEAREALALADELGRK
ncbi:MAG: adenylate/guanylate cyclase domain-containing protein [Verrucomicrobiota bacterium]